MFFLKNKQKKYFLFLTFLSIIVICNCDDSDCDYINDIFDSCSSNILCKHSFYLVENPTNKQIFSYLFGEFSREYSITQKRLKDVFCKNTHIDELNFNNTTTNDLKHMIQQYNNIKESFKHTILNMMIKYSFCGDKNEYYDNHMMDIDSIQSIT